MNHAAWLSRAPLTAVATCGNRIDRLFAAIYAIIDADETADRESKVRRKSKLCPARRGVTSPLLRKGNRESVGLLRRPRGG